jgi:hypothetical protein
MMLRYPHSEHQIHRSIVKQVQFINFGIEYFDAMEALNGLHCHVFGV